MKNTVIINGSHNRLGNTTQLLSKIYPDLEVIYLADHLIELYNYSETYSKNDEFLAIINQLLKYDTIIFATPVYWYSMSSLMKIFFDRLTDLIGSLCDLTSGSGDKGTPVILIQGYFDNYTD